MNAKYFFENIELTCWIIAIRLMTELSLIRDRFSKTYSFLNGKTLGEFGLQALAWAIGGLAVGFTWGFLRRMLH